ncbi:MAG: AzlC family ABC transporter permease [Lachnospiraceae bacterium]|nr:AzlC family ABC transporter permease [Lachnospiraceae bacterium]
MQPKSNRLWFAQGIRDGIPIALGYLAVSFTLGIAARNAGFNPWQAFFVSLTNNASAGEYAGFTLIAAGASYLQVALITLITNARYLLMSCSLSQKLSPDTPMIHRLLVAYDVTDEIFGISIAVAGKLNPFYNYGAMAVALPGWAVGTYLGVMMGNILPARVVSALSVGLFGMFLAIIIPPARKSKVILTLVVISMVMSYLCGVIPFLAQISTGMRTILLTVVISLIAAILFPHEEEPQEVSHEAIH